MPDRPDGRPARYAEGVCVNDLLALNDMLDGDVLTAWERGFVVGCTRHFVAGLGLSEKQLKTLAEIRALAEARATA